MLSITPYALFNPTYAKSAGMFLEWTRVSSLSVDSWLVLSICDVITSIIFSFLSFLFMFFFFNDPAPPEIYTLSLHDALPICIKLSKVLYDYGMKVAAVSLLCQDERVFEAMLMARSEEHTSELQSPCNLVCRLLLEKKKK